MSRSIWRGVGQQLRRSTTQRAVTIERTSLSIRRCYGSSARQQPPPLRRDGTFGGLNEFKRYYWRRGGDTIGHNHRNFARTRRRFSASAPGQHGHIDPPKPGEEYVIGLKPSKI